MISATNQLIEFTQEGGARRSRKGGSRRNRQQGGRTLKKAKGKKAKGKTTAKRSRRGGRK